MIALTDPETATGDPAPAGTTTAPPRAGIADIPATPTRHVEAERIAASQSASAEASRSAAAEKASKVEAKKAAEQEAAEQRAYEEELRRLEEEADQEEEDNDSGGSTYYKNCTAVRAAGADPIRRGDPGYGRHLDRDGDGGGLRIAAR